MNSRKLVLMSLAVVLTCGLAAQAAMVEDFEARTPVSPWNPAWLTDGWQTRWDNYWSISDTAGVGGSNAMKADNNWLGSMQWNAHLDKDTNPLQLIEADVYLDAAHSSGPFGTYFQLKRGYITGDGGTYLEYDYLGNTPYPAAFQHTASLILRNWSGTWVADMSNAWELDRPIPGAANLGFGMWVHVQMELDYTTGKYRGQIATGGTPHGWSPWYDMVYPTDQMYNMYVDSIGSVVWDNFSMTEPVPEPATLTVLALGLVASLARRRR